MKARRSKVISPVTSLSVYDGRTRLGCLVERGRSIEAFDANNQSVGIFASQHEAVRKLPSSGGGQ